MSASPRRRRLLWTGASLVVLLLAAFGVVHTTWFQGVVRDALVRRLEASLGAELSVDTLAYSLWKGEASATGVQFRAEDGALDVRVDRVEAKGTLRRLSSLELTRPDVRVRREDSDSNDAASTALPPWLLSARIAVADGRFQLDDPTGESLATIEGIRATLAPEGESASGPVSLGPATFDLDDASLEVGSLAAELRLGAQDASLDGLRLEAEGAVVEGEVDLPSLSPLTLEARLTHAIPASLAYTLVPALEEQGVEARFEGDVELSYDGSALRGNGTLRANPIRSAALEPLSVEAPWALEGDRLQLDSARIEGYGGTAVLSATLDLETDRQEVDARLERIELPAPVSSRVDGELELALDAWALESARGRASFSIQGRPTSPLPLTGDVRLTVEGARVLVEAPALRAPGIELAVSGEVGERLALDYRARVDDVAAALGLPSSVTLAGGARLEGRLGGTPASPAATATIDGDGLTLDDNPLELGASARWSGDRLVVERAQLRNETGAITLEGSYDLASESVSVLAESEGFALAGVPDLSGRVNAVRVEAEGPLNGLSGRASASIESVAYRGVPIPDASLLVDVEGADADVELMRMDGSTLATARIATAAPYAASGTLELDGFPVAELVRTLSGHEETSLDVSGRVRLQGNLSSPESIRYRIEGDQVVGSYREVGFGVGSPFVVEGDLSSIHVSELTLVGEDTAIGIEGLVPLEATGALDVGVRGVVRLEILNLVMPEAGISGRADLDVTARGTLSAPELSGSLSLSDGQLELAGVSAENVEGRFRVEGERVQVEELRARVLGGTVAVEGQLPSRPNGDGAVQLSLRATDLDLSVLLSDAAGDSRGPVAFSFSADIQGNGLEPSSWRALGTVDRLEVPSANVSLAEGSSGEWTFDGRTLALPRLELQGGGTLFAVDAEVEPFGDPLAYRARARGSLAANLLNPLLAESGIVVVGAAEVDVSASRADDGGLSLEGRASVRNARVSIREPAIAFSALDAEIVLKDDVVTLERLDAVAGGGTVGGSGTITLDQASIGSADLTFRASSVRLSYPEGLRSELNGELRLGGSESDFRVTGDVVLERAIFSRDISVESELLQSMSRAVDLAPEESFLGRTRLDVRVRTREGLRIDNNLARMEASGNLTLGGTLESPELFGTVTARPGGQFRFGRNRYRVESGRIALSGYPVEPPELDITARTSVADYDIRMRVQGPTDDLRTELSGTSQLNQSEISRADAASLLVTGRTIDKVSTEGRAILGEQMVSLVGSTLGDLAELGLGDALPFRIVTVEPSLVSGEVDPNARFPLGIALTDDLSLVYSIGLADTEKQIWIVDYQLPRRMRTQLIRQESNEVTAALSQQISLGDRTAGSSAEDSRNRIGSFEMYVVTGEPGDFTERVQERFRLREGERFDYWRAWDQAEKARSWLRDDGFLEATVDLGTEACGEGCVDVDVVVVTGQRVRFEWVGVERDDDLEDALVASWNGYVTPAFLESELALVLERELFAERYFQARAEVEVIEGVQETRVAIRLTRGPRGSRVRVRFSGNEAIPAEELLLALPEPRSPQFHALITSKRPRLIQLLELRYASFGYLQADVSEPLTSYDLETGVFSVEIPLEEGPRSIVSGIVIEGAESIDERTLKQRIALREGGAFRLTDFVRDRSALASYYRRQGFPEVEVDSAIIETDEPGRLEARFAVREGDKAVVGEVRVAGNVATRESVIRRELALRPGETLRMADINETQRRLYELGIFRAADVVVSESAEDDSRRSLLVDVSEVPAVTLDYGLRYTTGGLFETLADVRAPNLFGRAHQAGLRSLIGSDRQVFRLSYHTPYVARFKIDTNFFVERSFEQQSPDPDEFFSPFTDRTWTFTAQQNRPLQQKLTLQWSYSFKRTVTEIEAGEFDFGNIVFDVNRAIVTTSLIGDYRNNVVRPTRGTLWTVTVQGAPETLGSDLKFLKTFGQLFAYVPLGREDLIWASGYRFGATNSFGQRLVEDDRFQAGGPGSVRGFEQGSLGPVDDILLRPIGGAAVIVLNQELRFPLLWRLRGVGFYDAGNAFETSSALSFRDLRQSAGLGLRIEMPFGVLRVDWARVLGLRPGEDPWRLIFNIGHAF